MVIREGGGRGDYNYNSKFHMICPLYYVKIMQLTLTCSCILLLATLNQHRLVYSPFVITAT